MPTKKVIAKKVTKSSASKKFRATQGRTVMEFTAENITAAKRHVESKTDIREGWEYEWTFNDDGERNHTLNLWNSKGTWVASRTIVLSVIK